MNKRGWRKRARAWKRAYLDTDKTIMNLCEQINALSEREAAALNQAEATRQQVLKHAATIADLREQLVSLQEYDMLDLLEEKQLLAWQRRVREEARLFADRGYLGYIDLIQAIESDGKGETC